MYAKHIPTSEKVDFPYQRPQQASGSLTFEPRKDEQPTLSRDVLKKLDAFGKREPQKEGV
ncbi:hypothetical protein SAMN05660710_02846 [Paracoccus tibetensis]|uniref:Uncharacterized protein n=1 Tax=Paracoccus tibetensis TaxID=336292 RepID=A0A1G5IYD2_9RHOB|nr:hypothetical protein SAMN05660710_02846 [Paracoccus tibetensis]